MDGFFCVFASGNHQIWWENKWLGPYKAHGGQSETENTKKTLLIIYKTIKKKIQKKKRIFVIQINVLNSFEIFKNSCNFRMSCQKQTCPVSHFRFFDWVQRKEQLLSDKSSRKNNIYEDNNFFPSRGFHNVALECKSHQQFLCKNILEITKKENKL